MALIPALLVKAMQHRCSQVTVDGLQPGTQYFYKVGDPTKLNGEQAAIIAAH